MTPSETPASRPSLSRRFLRAGGCGMLVVLLLGAAFAAYLAITRPSPNPETEIFQGVFYSCHQLPETKNAGGRLFLIRVDLCVSSVARFAFVFLCALCASVVKKN